MDEDRSTVALIDLLGQHDEYKYQLRVRNPVRQCVKQVACGRRERKKKDKRR